MSSDIMPNTQRKSRPLPLWDHVPAIEVRANATHKELVEGIMKLLALRRVVASETDAARFKDKKGHWRFARVRPGWPDITGCCQGRFFGIEVKTPKDDLRPDQIECRDDILRAGGYWTLARTVEDAMRLINTIERDVHGAVVSGRNIRLDGDRPLPFIE